MTEYCLSCLGCQQMEQEDFHGVHRCPQYVDGQNEGQIEMEESQWVIDIIHMGYFAINTGAGVMM